MTSAQPDLAASPPAGTARPRAERRLFYGWYLVATGFLANAALAFTISSTLSIFLKPITTEFGVSRGVFSLLKAGEQLVHVPLAPLIGPIIDRHGARGLLASGALVTGAGFVLSGLVADFGQFLAVRIILMGVGVTLGGFMVINVALSKWFVRQRGRAIGLSTVGHGMAKLAMPALTTFLIAALGWRATWAVYGLLTWAMILVPALLWVRKSPEEMGLSPDGDAAPPAGGAPLATPRALADQRVWGRAEVLRSPATWLIVVSFGVSSVGVTGLNLHLYPFLTDRGFSELIAAAGMTSIALCQGAGALIWGVVADRIDVRRAGVGKFLLQAIGLLTAITATPEEPVRLITGLLIYGLGMGGTILQDILWAEAFGRRSLGLVRGVGMPFSLTFAAGGPLFFGLLFDLTGSYDSSFALFILALAISGFLVTRIPLNTPRAPALSGQAI